MKQILATAFFALVLMAYGVSVTKADTTFTLFADNLSFGVQGSSDVTALQQFLTDQGVYSGPVTGNFFSLTFAAVKLFQSQNGIVPVSGYVGPLTRAKANAIIASEVGAYNQQFVITLPVTTSTPNNTIIGPMVSGTAMTSPEAEDSLRVLLEARIGGLFQELWNLQGATHEKGGGGSTTVLPVAPTSPSSSGGGGGGGGSGPSAGTDGSGSFGISTSSGGSSAPTSTAPVSTGSTASPSIVILPAVLPSGMVGVSYAEILMASTTATGTFSWSIISGALSTGLSLNTSLTGATTTISGKPTLNTTSKFTVKVSNGMNSSTGSYSLSILPKAASTLTVSLVVVGGTALPGNFNLTIKDSSTILFSGSGVASQKFTILQGDIYSVSEATTTNSGNYSIVLGAGCSGTMATTTTACVVTNTYTAPRSTTPTSTTSTSTTSSPSVTLQWGAYVGDGSNSLSSFESLVGAKVNILADFEDWSAGSFPSYYASTVGAAGKTLLIFWEPQYDYDSINVGQEDAVIAQFAAAAKAYGYPVILAPFDEMNLNENTWGAYQGTNTPAKFIQAWQHVHSFFAADTNVKFAWDVNNESEPNTTANSIASYYPGSAYVDYVGMDGFNFGDPTQSFDQVFDGGVAQLEGYGKPIYIFSTASTEYSGKAAWITEGLGTHIKTYANIAGWIWFNQNDATTPGAGDTINWTVNSDSSSLAAFKSVIP